MSLAQDSINRPFMPQSPINGIDIDSGLFRPIGNGKRFIVVGKESGLLAGFSLGMRNLRSLKSFFNIPSLFVYSMPNKPIVYPSIDIAPLRQGFSDAINHIGNVIAPVVVLLFARAPLAVFRGIRPVIIDSVDRVLGGWGCANVAEEEVKAISPSVANKYASSPVSGIAIISSKMASIYHRAPYKVFRMQFCHDQASRMYMSC